MARRERERRDGIRIVACVFAGVVVVVVMSR
jgi:hypothetical protein